jgi:hypothetical protein
LIITIAFMNFYIDLSRVALASYPLYRPPKEQPIMKRQLLLSLTLSMLASTAFALPAAEQATPQVKSSHSVFSQTVAADGSDRTPQGQTLAENGRNRLEEKGLVQDGYDKTPQGQAVAEGGRDRLEEKGLVQDGYDKTPQGQALASDGYDKTPQGQTLASDGSDRTPQGQTLAEGGGDRTPQGQTLAEGGGDRVIERNSALS